MLVENELEKKQDVKKKLQTYNSSIFIGRSYFFNDEAQLYLTFQKLYYTLKRLSNTEKVVSSKSKGLWAGKLITLATTIINNFSPSINYNSLYFSK